MIPYIAGLLKGYGRGKGYGQWTERKEGKGHGKGQRIQRNKQRKIQR